MGVPEPAQPKLIKLGIYLSILLRVLFILFGIAMVQKFHWLIYLFGALLIWTAWKMLTAEGSEHVDPTRNILYRIAAKLFPVHDEGPSSRRIMVRYNGRWCITPLFLVFLVIGSTDVLFALDSIPAIMGISEDPFVVLTSNVFAVLGLNSLFFALRGVMGMFVFLKHGVSLILFFIGAKMLAGMSHPVDEWFKTHSFVSLVVIVSVLAVSIVLSIWHNKTKPVTSNGNLVPPGGGHI
jgi:tellurite resistance protein TerC